MQRFWLGAAKKTRKLQTLDIEQAGRAKRKELGQ
jgi:hypothetical protein